MTNLQKIDALPDVTHLQALVLSRLMKKDWQSARSIREQLNDQYGISSERPTMYLLLQRMNKMNFIEEKAAREIMRGEKFTHHVYRVTEQGRAALKNGPDLL